MILPMIYNKGKEYSILSQLKPENPRLNSQKNFLNLGGEECKIGVIGKNYYSFAGKDVLFVMNHGGGIPTVLFKPKPVTVDSFHERRFTLETYIRFIRSNFSLNLYENNKIILMAVCFAAKKPTFGNSILAVELAKRLRIHVLAADSIVNVLYDSAHVQDVFKNGVRATKKLTIVKDLSTHGNWYLIDPQGKMQKLMIPEKINRLQKR